MARFEYGDTISHDGEEATVLLAHPDTDGWIVAVDCDGEYRTFRENGVKLVRSLSAKNVSAVPATALASTPAGPPPAGVALSTADPSTVERGDAVEPKPSHGTAPAHPEIVALLCAEVQRCEEAIEADDEGDLQWFQHNASRASGIRFALSLLGGRAERTDTP